MRATGNHVAGGNPGESLGLPMAQPDNDPARLARWRADLEAKAARHRSPLPARRSEYESLTPTITYADAAPAPLPSEEDTVARSRSNPYNDELASVGLTPAKLRAWAAGAGLDVPAVGVPGRRYFDAWRAAQPCSRVNGYVCRRHAVDHSRHPEVPPDPQKPTLADLAQSPHQQMARAAARRADAMQLVELLSLVEVEVDAGTVENWTGREVKEAAEWATAVHQSASDYDDVLVPPRPAFLPAAEPVEDDDEDRGRAARDEEDLDGSGEPAEAEPSDDPLRWVSPGPHLHFEAIHRGPDVDELLRVLGELIAARGRLRSTMYGSGDGNPALAAIDDAIARTGSMVSAPAIVTVPRGGPPGFHAGIDLADVDGRLS